jgi:hypothetical protein
MAEALLSVSGLHTGYGATEILRGVDLAIQKGKTKRKQKLKTKRNHKLMRKRKQKPKNHLKMPGMRRKKKNQRPTKKRPKAFLIHA